MSASEVTVPELVRRAAEEFGEREAVVDGEVRFSFGELAVKVEQAGKSMLAYGVRPGDRVALWAPNSWEWIVTALGAVSVGGVLVPLSTRFKAAEVAYILKKSRARMIAVSGPFLGVDHVAELASVRAELPDLEIVTVFSDNGTPPILARRQFRGPGNKIAHSVFAEAAGAVSPDDIGDLVFTSGTTGHPKGVETTHGQTTRVFDQWAEIVGLRAGDRYLMVNPFSHTFGYKAGILACLMRGATMYPVATFDAEAVLETVVRERITVVPGAPSVYQTLLAHPGREAFDLSSLRLAVTGAAIIPVELVHRMRDELGFAEVITAYGLTEATGTATMCRQGDDPETIARTSGRAIADVEVRIVDADGWLHTGDVGVLDAAGNLRITDRIKDMYIVGGFNAYPAEVEQVLAGHPAIQEAAVVGVPDDRLGEVGKAFVVAAAGAAVDPDEVIAWARERLANYKAPKYVEVVEAFPRNSLGKILKRELR